MTVTVAPWSSGSERPGLPRVLATLRDLVDSGRLSPAIDRTFSLVDVPAAISYLEQEHARAKVVVSVLS